MCPAPMMCVQFVTCSPESRRTHKSMKVAVCTCTEPISVAVNLSCFLSISIIGGCVAANCNHFNLSVGSGVLGSDQPFIQLSTKCCLNWVFQSHNTLPRSHPRHASWFNLFSAVFEWQLPLTTPSVRHISKCLTVHTLICHHHKLCSCLEVTVWTSVHALQKQTKWWLLVHLHFHVQSAWCKVFHGKPIDDVFHLVMMGNGCPCLSHTQFFLWQFLQEFFSNLQRLGHQCVESLNVICVKAQL